MSDKKYHYILIDAVKLLKETYGKYDRFNRCQIPGRIQNMKEDFDSLLENLKRSEICKERFGF